RLRLDRPAEVRRMRRLHRGAVRGRDLLDDVRLRYDAAVRDRRGDHRHLERRREHPLLTEGEAARVDLRRRILRVEEVRALVETARVALATRRLERRRLVEAEALRVGEDRAGADLLADVAEDRVDGVLERRREVEMTEHLAAALVGVAGVRDLLAVLLAVAGI